MPGPSKGIGAGRFGPATAGGINYLLAIAIDAYDHLPLLYNCKKDAETFINLLLKNFQFEEQHVTRIFDKKATLERFHSAFRDLIEKITPADNLVIYYSGHGEYDSLTNEGFWIPVEARQGHLHEYFPNDNVRRYLGSIQSHHTFLIADSCFSGALFEEGTGKSGGSRSEQDPSRWGLTAGRKEIVSDGKPGMHSPFADALLYRLEHNQGSLGVQKLCADVLEQVEANAWQTPIGEPLRVQGHRNGQFYFHPKRDEAKTWQAALAANSIDDLLDFEAQFPQSPHVTSGELDERIAALEDEQLWREAARSNTVSGYREYLHRTKTGKYRQEANDAISSFRRKEEEAHRREQEKQAEDRRRREAEDARRKEAEIKAKPVQPVPRDRTTAFSWGNLKWALAAALAIFVIIFIIGKLVNSSEKPATWVCEDHFARCGKIESPGGVYYMVFDGKAWGYADKNGEVFIPPRFQEVYPFDASGLALVKENNFYGWIDRQGQERISFIFEAAAPFANGKAKVKIKGEEFFIDEAGMPAGGGNIQPVSFPSPELVSVDGGQFMMGCTREQRDDCSENENPLHKVILKDFAIGKFEVTNEEFCAFLNERGNAPETGGGFRVDMGNEYCRIVKKGTVFITRPGFEKHPVVPVSWYGAVEYCNWLSEKTGEHFRLPSEAEWEYAARGGKESKGSRFAGGDNLREVAWISPHSDDGTKPVGTKTPNEKGIFDMSGNAWEWCADHWHDNYEGAPGDGQAWSIEGFSLERVVRGGSWASDDPRMFRVSFRGRGRASGRGDLYGFRVVQQGKSWFFPK